MMWADAELDVPRTRRLRHRQEIAGGREVQRTGYRAAVEALVAPEGSRDRSLPGKARIRARKAARRG